MNEHTVIQFNNSILIPKKNDVMCTTALLVKSDVLSIRTRYRIVLPGLNIRWLFCVEYTGIQQMLKQNAEPVVIYWSSGRVTSSIRLGLVCWFGVFRCLLAQIKDISKERVRIITTCQSGTDNRDIFFFFFIFSCVPKAIFKLFGSASFCTEKDYSQMGGIQDSSLCRTRSLRLWSTTKLHLDTYIHKWKHDAFYKTANVQNTRLMEQWLRQDRRCFSIMWGHVVGKLKITWAQTLSTSCGAW